MTGELRNKFKSSNGVWDTVELTSETARHIKYKLRLALGITWNPVVEKIHKIAPSHSSVKVNEQTIKLETWVRKSEIDRHDELFGEGRGFIMGKENPKLFQVGYRGDIEKELRALHGDQSLTLYLYQIEVKKSFYMSINSSQLEDSLAGLSPPQSYDSIQLNITDNNINDGDLNKLSDTVP